MENEREKKLMEMTKKFFIENAQEIFKFCGCADFENGCLLNTRGEKTLTLKMEIK